MPQFDRRRVRYVAAGLAATMAAIYYLIGLGVLDVGGGQSRDPGFLLGFGAMAGSAFLLGAILLARTDRRWLWAVGVLFQVFVYVGYLQVSGQRTPPFEIWGITLRIIQAPLLLALAYLAIRPLDAASIEPTSAGAG